MELKKSSYHSRTRSSSKTYSRHTSSCLDSTALLIDKEQDKEEQDMEEYKCDDGDSFYCNLDVDDEWMIL